MTCNKFSRIQRPLKLKKTVAITSVPEFIKHLKQNLKVAGVSNSENNTILAEYLMGLYLSNIPVIICGKYAINIANAFSATLCSKLSPVLELEDGYDDYAYLHNIIIEQNSEVIAFQNVIGILPESMYIHLSTDYSKYCFFFISEDKAMLKCLPAGLLSYCALIDSDNFIKKIPGNLDYIPGTLTFVSDIKEYDPKIYSEYYDKLAILASFIHLSVGYSTTRAKLLTILYGINKKYSRLLLMAPELISYSELWNRKKEFIKSVLDDDECADDEFYEYIEDSRI